MFIPSLDSNFLEVKKLKTVKKLLKVKVLDYYSKEEADECDLRLECLWSIWNYYTLSNYISSESRCTHFTKSSHQSLFKRQKKFWKIRLEGYISKAKTEDCDQKNRSVCNQFDMLISCSATYFLKVGMRFSLKVATKASLTGKKL